MIISLVFQWTFIPFLQTKLNAFKDIYNTGKKQADKNSILPQGGPPQMIFESPELYKQLDFKVSMICEQAVM